MLKRFCLTVCLIFLSISVQGKVLDIIIGGDIGQGLQCKEDSNCPSGEYCHQEQYYCVACKVPPYEWTGTTCQCPEGTVEKDGKNCVECLLDTDCKTDYNCDTDTNHCEYCKFPKLWVNNQCICPSGTREQAGACVCIQENTELDNKTGRCICILNEDKCGDVNFKEEECACCPADKPLYMAQMCRTCASVYPDRPIWNGTLKECVQCQTNKDCNGTTPVCELSTHTCEACPVGKPLWDNWSDRCVECLTHEDCNGTTPVCNASTHVCEPCPSEYPLWDATRGQCIACDSSAPFWSDKLGKCVECLANSDCTNAQKPLCDTDEGVCKACADNLYFDGENCVACRYDGEVYDKTRNKCVINLPTSTFNRDFGRRRQSYGIVNPKIGPYPVAYSLYATGSVDDYLHLDRHNAGNHYGGQTGNGGPTRGSCLNAGQEPSGWLINRYVGTLPANTTGMVWVYSHTGWNTFNPANGVAKIWLERSVDMK